MVESTVVVTEEVARYVVARADLQKVPMGVLAGEFVAEGLTASIFEEMKDRVHLNEKLTLSQQKLAFEGLYPFISMKELSRRTGLSEGYLRTLADAKIIPGRAINPKKRKSHEFLRHKALGWCRSNKVKELFHAFPKHLRRSRPRSIH